MAPKKKYRLRRFVGPDQWLYRDRPRPGRWRCPLSPVLAPHDGHQHGSGFIVRDRRACLQSAAIHAGRTGCLSAHELGQQPRDTDSWRNYRPHQGHPRLVYGPTQIWPGENARSTSTPIDSSRPSMMPYRSYAPIRYTRPTGTACNNNTMCRTAVLRAPSWPPV